MTHPASRASRAPRALTHMSVERARRLYAVYGLTEDDYNALLAEQQHLCAICQVAHHPERPLVVDHNHHTGKVRALLCSECNTGIGLLQDSARICDAAADYLRREGSYSEIAAETDALATHAPSDAEAVEGNAT